MSKISKTLLNILTSLFLVSSFISCAGGAGIFTNAPVSVQIVMNRQNIGIGEKVVVQALINNPFNHSLEYRFTADRGQVATQNMESPVAEYTAPFSGGEDIIRLAIFDRNDNINLPQVEQRFLIFGDGVTYVALPPEGTLADTDNGVIRVTGAGASTTQPVQVAVGRQPVISPDGRFLAYTYYPGDGTSQVRVQDARGNVTIVSGSSQSFSRDPAWAPIGNDREQILAFATDRLSSRNGQGFDGRGENYNIWTVNARGNDLRQLTSTPGSDYEPTWSPDGRYIVFRSNFSQNKANNFWNLWRIERGSGRLVQLTHETVPDMGAFDPSYSPDGRRLIYARKYLKREPSNLFDFTKIWMIDFARIDFNNLTAATPGGDQGFTPPNNSAVSVTTFFGQIATQEFDEATVESSPNFTPDGMWISYVLKRGQEVRTVRVPSNPGNLGTVGFEPVDVPGIVGAVEVSWARQLRSFGRF